MTSATLPVPAIHMMAVVTRPAVVTGPTDTGIVGWIWAGLIAVGLIAIMISGLRWRWERWRHRGKPPDPNKPEQRRQEFEEMMGQGADGNAAGPDEPAAS